MWTIMLFAIIIILLYILLIALASADIRNFPTIIQFIIVITISIIYLFAAFAYFTMKYPTLF